MSRVAITILITVLAGCRSAPIVCELEPTHHRALERVVSAGWDGMTPDVVADMWPSPVTWGANAPGVEPCTGTATFSSLDVVLANECLCCDTFGFTDVRRENACDKVLSSVTVVRHVPDLISARRVAASLLAAVGSAERVVLPVTTSTRALSAQSSEIVRLEINELASGWRVRLLLYRVSPDS